MQTEFQYILEVYKTRNFSQAAKNLFITQPALSIAIKKIEKEIRMPLFDRSHKPLTLTPAGRIYVQNILRIKEIENDLSRSIEDLDNLNSGELHIAGTQYLNSHVIAPAINSFITKYPKVHFILWEDNSGKLDNFLKNGLADMILHCGPIDESLFHGYSVFKDHLLLAIPKQLLTDKKLLIGGLTEEEVKANRFLQPEVPYPSLSQFNEIPLLLLTQSNDLRKRALAICEEENYHPPVRFNVEQLETAYYLAAHGLGAAFVSDILIKEHHFADHFPELLFFKIKAPEALRTYHAITHKGAYLSHSMKAFINLVKNTWKDTSSYVG
jgi:DNA-binding transcriptional LysR family regulator